VVNLKFGIELVPDRAISTLVEYAIIAEQNGLDSIWVTDHYCNRTVYIALTMMAIKTSKITLGVGVTNPYVIHPAWTAAAVATLDEVSGGRAILGIGSGDKATLEAIGIERKKPLTAVREAVTVIRRLLAGEVVNFEGEFFKLKGARLNFKPSRAIPIYIGAQAPKMLQLAGQLGDGVLINASHPKDFEKAIPLIKKGAEAAGKDFSKIDIVAYTCFSVAPDSKKAKDAARLVVAFIVAGAPDTLLKERGIDLGKVSTIREALAKGDFKKAAENVDDLMLDYFSISGSPDECIEKLRELIKAGITHIVMGSPLGPKKKEALALIGEIVKKLRS